MNSSDALILLHEMDYHVLLQVIITKKNMNKRIVLVAPIMKEADYADDFATSHSIPPTATVLIQDELEKVRLAGEAVSGGSSPDEDKKEGGFTPNPSGVQEPDTTALEDLINDDDHVLREIEDFDATKNTEDKCCYNDCASYYLIECARSLFINVLPLV